MKKLLLVLFAVPFIAFTLCLTGCKKKTETVFVTPKISVELPSNFKYFESQSTSSEKGKPGIELSTQFNYRVSINDKDDIMVTKMVTHEYDTLDISEKREILKKGNKAFVRGFNGRNLTSSEKEINGMVQSDFSFEFGTNDSLFRQFGRFVIQDSNLVYFGYIHSLPPLKRSFKIKDQFFKSIKYN